MKEYILLIILHLLIVIISICYFVGIRFNTSESIPIGIYKIEKGGINKGDYILFIYTKDINRNRKQRIGKMVWAKNGDNVTIDSTGIYINFVYVENSKPKEKNSKGEELPRIKFSRKLKQGEYIVVSKHKGSFDSRYLGVITDSLVIGKIKPVLIKE